MEKEKTDLVISEKKNIVEQNLSDEHLFFKYAQKNIENIVLLDRIFTILSILLIYIIGFIRRSVTRLILVLLKIFESHPNFLIFLLLLIGITTIIFKFNKSKYSFLFGFITACLTNYALYKIKLLYIPNYTIKYIAKFLKKIYFILHILLSLFISKIISICICSILEIIRIINKVGKVYTTNDKDYIMKLLETDDESLFILYTEISDPNNDFYKEQLSKISTYKKGKYFFIIIHYFTEFEIRLYSMFFNEKNDQPKFGVKKGNIKKFIEKFPKKENFFKNILDFVDKYEFEENKEKINKNLTNNKEEEKKDEENVEIEKDKDKDKGKDKEKEDDKKKMMEENVE